MLAPAGPGQDPGGSAPRQILLDCLRQCESAAPPSRRKLFDLSVAFREAVRSGEARTWSSEELAAIVERARRCLTDGRTDYDEEFEYDLASLFIEQNQLRRARDVLAGEGRAVTARVRPAFLVARRLTLLADVERVLGDYAAAIANLQEAVQHWVALAARPPARPLDDEQRRDLQSVLADAFGVWSEVLRENGRLTTAAAMVEHGRALAEASESIEAQQNALLREIDLLLACGHYDRVLACLGRAENALPEVARKDAAAAAWQQAWIRLVRGATQLRLAVHDRLSGQKAAETLGTLVADTGAPRSLVLLARARLLELALLDSDLECARRELAACEREVAASPARGHSGERTQIAVLAARLARQAGCDDATLAAHDATLRDTLDREMTAWNSLPMGRQGFGFLHLSARRTAVAEAIEIRLELARRRAEDPAEAAVAILLEIQACAALARAGNASCSLAGLRQHVLPPGGGILVYWPAGGASHAFTIERARVRHWRLPPESDVLAAARTLRESLIALATGGASPERRRGQIAAFDTAAAAARDAVLPADLRAVVLGWRSLTVAGADLLGDLPFEVLPIGDGMPVRLLGEKVAVASVPSLAWAEHVARRPRQGSGPRQPYVTLLACTDSVHAHKARGAPFPRDRAKPLVPLTSPCRAFLDADATRQRLAAAGRTRILHVIAHGQVRDDELRSGLVLHDGEVWHEDLASTAAAFDALCILSVCKAGGAENQFGDGQLGTLGGALLWAGARAVVQSRDDLFVHDHLQLLAHFYAALREDPPARALQRARAAMAGEGDLGQRVLRAELQVIGLGHERL